MGLSRSGFGFVIVLLLLLVVVVIPTGFSVAAASDASCSCSSSSSSSSAIPIAPNPNPDPADSPSASASAATSSRTRTRILPDVTGAIGRTPLVCLSRIAKHYGIDPSRDGTILAKLEYLSPGSSKKDRIALSIIERARADGSLKPGQPVVELTSGNTGTGLAIVCGVLGHPFVAIMSKGNSEERAIAMRALGAEVVLVDQQTPDEPPNEDENEHFNGGSKSKSKSNSNNKNYGRVSGADLDLVDRKAREITTALCAFRADQFVRASNKEAHLYGTGPELWADSGGSITDFCDFVGTGGSFGGIAEYLKKQNPSVKCYIVEPEAAAVLREEALGKDQKAHPNHLGNAAKSGGHKIQGGGYSKSRNELPMIDDSAINNDDEAGDDDDDEDNVTLVDGYLTVSDDEAIAATRALARWEGIFGGFSGGANFVAAVKLLKKRRAEREQEGKPESSSKPAVVAILICDSGLKYLSTDLWEGSK